MVTSGPDQDQSNFIVPTDLITHPINFNSPNNPFTIIDKNEFQDKKVEEELLLEYANRMEALKILKLQGDRKWTCECDNGKGRDGDKRRGEVICTDMNKCRNLGANLNCPPNCGDKSGATCWNQHFKNPSITFPNSDSLLIIESQSIGLGVITLKKILKGTVTGEFIGVVSRGCTGTDDDVYAAQLAELSYHITPIEKGNYTRFFNHCGINPNHDALCYFTPTGPRILFVASQDIDPGQECTWHYGEYWHRTFMEMDDGKCSCRNCIQSRVNNLNEESVLIGMSNLEISVQS